MPEKIGGGGELEEFSPNDGKYVADGKPNKYYNNPEEHKKAQLKIILNSNPAHDDYHTWIREEKDIKTFKETLEDSDWVDYDYFNPDYSKKMADEALDSGYITVYSSYPIEQGIFVTPSKMEAESYAGNGKIFSKKVSINDVAWIDPTQGQYAKVEINNSSEEVEEYKIPGLDMSHPSAVLDVRRMAFDKLIDNDKTRLYRYREWANNSNDDYKKYIYDDLKSEKKEATLNIWYNTYKSSTGNYNISFEDFLNTPIKLYRATNIGEKEDYSNPFFSYATTRKMAERFLDDVQRLNSKRTGDIEEIEIKPIDTFGMFPSDENEIIIPNKKYEELLSKVDNLIAMAEKQNVKLPYDRETLIELFRKDKKQEKVEQFEKDILRYINRNNVKK